MEATRSERGIALLAFIERPRFMAGTSRCYPPAPDGSGASSSRGGLALGQRVVRYDEAVPQATDGLDEIGADLAAEGRHVDLDDVGARVEVDLPDELEQLPAREDLALVAQQARQQRELPCRQEHVPAVQGCAVGRQVDAQGAGS